LSVSHDGDAVDYDGVERFVVGVAFNAGDGPYKQHRVCVAESEDGVLSVELRDGLLRDEELATVGAAAGWPWAGVSHGEEAGLVEGKGGIDLVLEEVARIAGAVTSAVTALDHKGGDDAMEGGAVVEGLVVDLLKSFWVGPVFSALGEADKTRYGDGGFLFEELAGETAHSGVNNSGWAGGYSWGLELAGSARSVGKLLGGGWGRLRLRGYVECQNECESTKRHAVV
jgi:hypothetical protein